MEKKQRRQQGFTLIEIIAVIILLGVLAATVIPKFTDLTAQAKAAAAKQAVAEAIARVNQAAGEYILTNSVPPTTLAHVATYMGTDSANAGDYTLTFTDNSDGTIAVGGSHKTYTDGVATGTAYLPTAP